MVARNNEFQLIRRILARSVSRKCWDKAHLEWELVHVYFTSLEEPGRCLCMRYPIVEHCVLRNKLNENTVVVGNCCVKKFLGLASHLIFDGFARIKENLSNAMNADTIEYARKKDWLGEWQYEFYMDTWRKRKLSEKQLVKRREINSWVLGCLERDNLRAEGGVKLLN